MSASVVLLAEDLTSGDGRAALALAGRLATRGFRASVIAATGEPESPACCEVVRCPGLARRWGWSFSARRIPRPGHDTSRPVLIHALRPRMAPVALELAERWKVPYFVTIDEFFPDGGSIRVSPRLCRALIAAGPEIAEELRLGMGVPPSLIAEIPFGVERPGRISRFRDLASVPVVGSSAPLAAGSGMTTFLNAARRVSEVRRAVEFVIAGEGPLEPDLRRLASRLGIAARVTFADDPARGRPFWGVLDAFCQPSLVPCCGRRLASALAFGIPSIATDVPGLRPWLAGDPRGRLVQPGDAEALAASILELLADPWSAAESGRLGRDRVAALADADREADALAALYVRILDDPSAQGLRFDQGIAAASRPAGPAPAPGVPSARRRS